MFTRCKHLLLILLAVVLTAAAQSPAPKAPPKTRTDNVKEVLHGVELVDPYRWLEDQNAPETRAWIDAQNEFSQSVFKTLPGRDALKQRLTELLKTDVIGAPAERGGRYFFSKRLADQDLSVIYVRKGWKGADEVLIDPHPLSADHTTSVNLVGISKDGTLVAYGIRRGGEDELEIHLLDVDSRKELGDLLPRARYSFGAFRPDKKGFYYARYTREGPRVYYHAVGSDPAGDAEIFGKGFGAGVSIGPDLSDDGRYLLLQVFYGAGAGKSEVYFQDVAGQGPIVPIVNDLDARFFGGIEGTTLYLQTNWQAANNRILAVDLTNPARGHWREIIPAGDAPIQGFSMAGGKLFVRYLKNVISVVKVFDPAGKYLRDISFPALGTVSGVGGRWDGNEAFFSFSSYHIPPTIYRYDVARGTQDVWARLNVPVDSKAFEVKQVWYESKDKTRVPMFLMHKKGIQLDGSHPVYLTGYGGFNVSQTPGYSSTAVLWAEQGGVYAVTNMRGGGEFGEEWHKAGMLEKKQNVFDDFISAAEWLVQNKYTSSSKLAIAGGSNGGLLVGAALTQRPDLFQAVVCSVPLLDMVRYHRFLVARFWIPEYGSSEDPAQFKYIYTYSPYHHVKPGTKYPAVLFVSGDSDTRVDPLHARKMTALLQASTGSDRPVLLLYDTKAGHSGGKPISRQIEDTTDTLNFLFWQLGAAQKPK